MKKHYKIPGFSAEKSLTGRKFQYRGQGSGQLSGVIPQGCDIPKKIACAGAVAACVAACAGGPAACAQCFAGVGAAGCIECL